MTPPDTTTPASAPAAAIVSHPAAPASHPAPHVTHRVTNQPPEREGVNEYLDHPVLREAVHAYGGVWGEDRLVEVGALVGSGASSARPSSRTSTSPCCARTTVAGTASTRSSTTRRTTR